MSSIDQIVLEVNNIVKGIPDAITMKIVQSGLAYKSLKTKKKVSIRIAPTADGSVKGEVSEAGGYALFDGFRNSEKATITDFAKTNFADVDFEDEEKQSVSGWNWGQANVEGGNIKFEVLPAGPTGSEWFPAFRIPLTAVQKSYPQGTGKREAIIEFQRDEEDQLADKAPQLDSMRLYYTTKGNEEEKDANSHAENLIQDIMSHVQDEVISEDAIFKFDGDFCLMCLNLSRAKYAFHMYASQIRVQSNTYDHFIKYDQIKKMFLLPVPKGGYNFVLKLDPPLRRRNKTEAYIVVQFGDEDPIPDAEINTEGEGIADMLGDLSTTFEDKETGETRNSPAHLLLGKILTKMTGKKVAAPDTFSTTFEEQCVGSHVESQQGYLYPLERALIYVHKPTIHIRYDDIVTAELLRANQFSAVQSFDLELFLEEKKVKLIVPKQKAEQVSSLGAFDSDDDGEGDPYKQQLLAQHGADSDDSENDSDFKAGEESSVDEEYGSDGDSGSGSGGSGDEGGERQQKKKKKKRKHEAEADGDGEDDGDSKKKKKKVKDPDAPKPPKSSYVLFCADARVTLKEEQPDLEPTKVMQALGVKWKELDEEAKKPYVEAATASKTKYLEEKEAYTAKLIAEGRMPAPRARAAPKSKLAKDPNAPKRPVGSFFLFVAETREKIKVDFPEIEKHTEISKKAGELWKALPADEKKVFEDKAAALKADYDVAFATYKESEGGKAFIAAAAIANPKQPRQRKPKAPGAGASKKQSTLNFKSAETIDDSDDD
eukprot:gene3032-15421_t